jgi:hypothetical protein
MVAYLEKCLSLVLAQPQTGSFTRTNLRKRSFKGLVEIQQLVW